MTKLSKVEFHCHTVFSKDSLTSPEKLLEVCIERDIDRVVVTDHNTIEGGKATRDLDQGKVIIGEEIMTLQGELLAAYVSEEIPAGLPAQEAIQRLRAQNAFISVSHPFDRFRKGHWEPADLLEIIPSVDAIETFNARCFPARYNRFAREFADRYGIPGTAGSDAHAPFEVGRAVMLLPSFGDADSLRLALQQAEFQVQSSPFWVRIFSRYAAIRSRRRRLKGVGYY